MRRSKSADARAGPKRRPAFRISGGPRNDLVHNVGVQPLAGVPAARMRSLEPTPAATSYVSFFIDTGSFWVPCAFVRGPLRAVWIRVSACRPSPPPSRPSPATSPCGSLSDHLADPLALDLLRLTFPRAQCAAFKSRFAPAILRPLTTGDLGDDGCLDHLVTTTGGGLGPGTTTVRTGGSGHRRCGGVPSSSLPPIWLSQ